MNKLFTHTDLDGIGCAVLATLSFRNNVAIEYCNYDEIDSKVLDFVKFNKEPINTMYITDISTTEETAKEIDGKCRIRLFDHHVTATHLNKYPWAVVDTTVCGTSLFYEHLTGSFKLQMNKTLDTFVDLVNSYDTWEWKKSNNQHAKMLHDILTILGRDKFIEEYVEILKNESDLFPQNFIDLLKGEDIKRDEYISSKIKEVVTVSLYEPSINNNYVVAYVESDKFGYLSELGNKICTSVKCDFCAIYTGVNMSLRSIGDMDVSIIAKRYGGGGHKNAAGCPVDELMKDLLNGY
jgi:oligoribonuclease NrnB/cAMP/cGMP phosphodiesterase (DHH superfamily)